MFPELWDIFVKIFCLSNQKKVTDVVFLSCITSSKGPQTFLFWITVTKLCSWLLLQIVNK